MRSPANDTHAPRLSGPNPLAPDRMRADERLSEVAELLAAGLLRLRARQAGNAESRAQAGLYSPADQSVCLAPNDGESL